MRISYGPEAFFQKYGGVTKYFLKLADGLAKKGHDVEIVAPLFVTKGLKTVSSARIKGLYVNAESKLSLWGIRTASILTGRAAITSQRPDIFHPTYYSLLDALPSRLKTVVTVYDFVHEKFGGRSYAETKLTRLRKFATINRADLILTISENTRNDLLEFFPRINAASVVVTPLGVESNPARPASGLPFKEDKILLWVGPRRRYKNFRVVVSAFRLLPKRILEGCKLVVFGGEPLTMVEIKELVASGLPVKNISQDFGDDAKLTELYCKARALLYTSKYEGFGLPILEAMAAGCPVICSSVSSMPEVAGDAALLVDPEDPEHVAAAIKELLEVDATHSRLQRRGLHRAALFSWDACVKQTERAYLRVLD